LSFTEWIRKLVQTKYQVLTPAELQLSARLGAMEMLKAGVTAVGEVMDVGSGWNAMLEFGLQGIAYQEVFGPAESAAVDAMKSLKEKVGLHRGRETETQRVGVSPHAPYSVSQPLYKAVGEYAQAESLRMTAHIAESREETLFVRDGAGPFAEAHLKRGIAVIARGVTPVAYLDRLELLGPKMLLVHAVEANDSDIDRLRDTSTFVVHCPKSNAKLGNASARIRDMRSRSVSVSLGTDSVASNNAIDMFEEMRAAIFQQRTLTRDIHALTAQDAFRMATLEGARALGLDKHLGSLEVGKRADFAVVDLSQSATLPVYDPIETMVYSASRADVKRVFVGGNEIVVEDSQVRKEISQLARRLRLPT
jgi:5-methylthioadenosine/S-adenosylhomocysteine deaminase